MSVNCDRCGKPIEQVLCAGCSSDGGLRDKKKQVEALLGEVQRILADDTYAPPQDEPVKKTGNRRGRPPKGGTKE